MPFAYTTAAPKNRESCPFWGRIGANNIYALSKRAAEFGPQRARIRLQQRTGDVKPVHTRPSCAALGVFGAHLGAILRYF